MITPPLLGFVPVQRKCSNRYVLHYDGQSAQKFRAPLIVECALLHTVASVTPLRAGEKTASLCCRRVVGVIVVRTRRGGKGGPCSVDVRMMGGMVGLRRWVAAEREGKGGGGRVT